MTTRTCLVALLVAFFVSAPAWAQEKQTADDVDRRLEMLDERLDLTDEQEAEIRQIWTQHREEMKAWASANENATREERRDYFRGHADEVQNAVQAVLTPEQATQLAEVRETMRGRVKDGHMRGERKGSRDDRGMSGQRDHRRGMRGDPGMFVDRVADALDLTDAQRSEVQAIIESHHAEGSAWRDANPDASREQMRAYHEGHFAQLKTELEQVLTDEQIDRFEELHEARRDRMFQRNGRK